MLNKIVAKTHQIQIRNSKIQGSSLSLKNYGEYVKVFGKARLTIN